MTIKELYEWAKEQGNNSVVKGETYRWQPKFLNVLIVTEQE